jgi:hypothetical protein
MTDEDRPTRTSLELLVKELSSSDYFTLCSSYFYLLILHMDMEKIKSIRRPVQAQAPF